MTERISEEELLGAHRPMPNVPIATARFVLQRSGCFGSCPSYSVEVRGSGQVHYVGNAFVDVPGEHDYQVSAAEVARLVESMRAKDLWSARDQYSWGGYDNPQYTLTLQLGDEIHTIEDSDGDQVGMPEVVRAFESEVDDAAHSQKWIELSNESLDTLQLESTDFHSIAAGQILTRAVMNEHGHDEQAMLRLLELGAPIDTEVPDEFPGRPRSIPPLYSALLFQRQTLIDPLVARGALRTDGKLDQKKLDRAFLVAIAAGSFPLVQKIWDISPDSHPSLTFETEPFSSDGHEDRRKTTPVTLALYHRRQSSRRNDLEKPWDGFAIAKWLESKGCDIKAQDADGATLLHIAAGASDIEMVRYLLSKGLSASTPTGFGTPAIGEANDEDVALALLEAGTDFSSTYKESEFRHFAEYLHWARVIAWLDAHHR